MVPQREPVLRGDATVRKRLVWVLIATIALVLALVAILPPKIVGRCGPTWLDPSFIVASALVASLAAAGLVGSIGTALGGSPRRIPSLWAVAPGILSLFIVLMPDVPLIEGYGLC